MHRIFVQLGDHETPIGDAEKKNHLTYQAEEDEEVSIKEIEKAVSIKDSIRHKKKRKDKSSSKGNKKRT